MRKLVCLLLCLILIGTFCPPVRAEENGSGFQELRAQIAPVDQVTAENSVVSTYILFQNVTEERECTLRWYIGDTLCREDRHFLLAPGAESSLECSVHFDNNTPARQVLWVELTANDGSGDTAVFTQRLLTRPINAAENPDGDDYIVHVIRNQCVVIVYEKDESGEPGRVVNVFVCSPGLYEWTITGRYTATSREVWLGLMDGVSGHYATLIWGDFLFHSVPYYGASNDQLKTLEYNKLGEKASAGCIRMAVSDAKWIYDNCLSGTTVRLFDSETLPVTKPVPIRIDPESPNAGWDPTDPNPANPTKARSIPKIQKELLPQLPVPLLFSRLAE